jgi:LysR family carnitine catabolism transcriptional activator
LGLSQPALSSQVRDLEAELGVSLFSRTTRSVALTVEGERFFFRAKQVVADLNSAVSDMKNQSLLAHGRIVIAATPSIASTLLPAAIKAFTQQFPDVTVQLHEDYLTGVESRVQSGIADFGIGPVPARGSELVFSPLFKEKFYGVVPVDHPLASQRSVSFDRLSEYPLLATSTGTGIRQVLDSVLQDRGRYMNAGHVVGRYETLLSMVAEGLGVAFLPALALLQSDPSRLHLLDVREPVTLRDIGFLQRKGGSSSSAAAATFIEHSLAGDLFDDAIVRGVRPGEHAQRLLKGIVRNTHA